MTKFKNALRAGACAGMLLAIAGCASLTSYKGDDAGGTQENGHLKSGLVRYALPRTILVVSANYLLTKCGPTVSDIAITATATVDTETAPDPNAIYYADSQSFQGIRLLKTSDLKVDVYPTGVLQSLNATLSDRTGAVAAAAFTAALNAAAVVGKGPFEKVAPKSLCKDNIQNAADTLAKDQSTIQAAPSSGPTALTPAALASLQAEIAALTKALTVTTRMRIDLGVGDFAGGSTASIPPENAPPAPLPFASWFNDAPPQLDADYTLHVVATMVGTVPNIKDTTVEGSSNPTGGPGKPIGGLVYRVPGSVNVEACFGKCDTSTGMQRSTNVAWQKDGVLVSQLGTALVAPLNNGMLRDSTLNLSQDATGTLTEVEFKNTSTVDTFFNTIGQAFSSQETQNTAAISANANAMNAQSTAKSTQANVAVTDAGLADTTLQKQADCLNQQAAIIKAGGTPIVSCQ